VKQPEERSNTKTTTIMEKKSIEPKNIKKLVLRSSGSKEQGVGTIPILKIRKRKKKAYRCEGADRVLKLQNINI